MYGECECFVMQMLYVCVLCVSCGSPQCCVLHDLQNAALTICILMYPQIHIALMIMSLFQITCLMLFHFILL